MAYTKVDFPTKKSLKEAVKRGDRVEVYQHGPFGPDITDGSVAIEGPHYPKPHRWYAYVRVVGGVVTEFIS